jgi:methylated-DNA-[protein]-cysteine S-methyltransferase
MTTMLETAELGTPVGRITVAVREGRLCALTFAGGWADKRARLARRFGRLEVRRTPDPGGVIGRLSAYLEGDLAALAPIEVDTGGTPFQERVWKALRTVPPASTVAYGDLARTIGLPTAVRAVGAANGANPVGIVVPCHRVIGADGRLVGYAGGLERKRWLLEHERAHAGGKG